MHFGIVAVKAEVGQLLAAFATCWPRHEPAASTPLAGLEALDAWMRATQRQVTAAAWSLANPGTDTFGFWQDGEWAVMLDPSYAQASDRKALAALSERFGLALSFIIETSGGCAFFDAFAQGRRVRRIQSIDGAVTSEGERLPQEAGLPASSYYMDETEQLQRAFGLTPLELLPADQPVTGAAYMDRTDYGALKKAQQPRAPGPVAAPAPRRPWWRFW
jgi:hypothetical protein